MRRSVLRWGLAGGLAGATALSLLLAPARSPREPEVRPAPAAPSERTDDAELMRLALSVPLQPMHEPWRSKPAPSLPIVSFAEPLEGAAPASARGQRAVPEPATGGLLLGAALGLAALADACRRLPR